MTSNFCLVSGTGSISALDEATLKEESHALQCTTAGPYNAIPTNLLRAGSVCGLGSDICGIHIISPAARFRTAASSGTLVNGLAEIRAAREYDGASICALTPEWEERFLKTSMAFSTMEASEYVRQIDRTGKIAESPNHRIQKAATTLLCDTIQNRDFALPVARWASKALGAISSCHVTQILPMICTARASRPGLAVGTLRLLCNGMCTTKRLLQQVLSSVIFLSQFGGTLGPSSWKPSFPRSHHSDLT